MRAIGFHVPGRIDRDDALLDLDLPAPVPGPRDLLVRVKALSVNPADTKVRASATPAAGQARIPGWDAAGVVEAVGPEVSLFEVGDEVFYAGDITRPGTYAELHLVDERIVGRKPVSLDWAAAAAMPLTSITAWEVLFDRLAVRAPVPGAARALLVIGGAGGVGSIAIQLARALTDLTVIATASRPETIAWALQMGAHHVIDHRRPLSEEVAALGIGQPGLVLSTTHTDRHIGQIAELIAPQGRFALIDDPQTLDIVPFKRKSVSAHWEFMFTRSMFGTADMAKQGALLNEVSRLIDAGRIASTMTERRGPISAGALRQVHALIENGTARGKIVLEGWPDA